jgi:hypothetical protein
MDKHTIIANDDAQELTLVDIEELRQALGAEAELTSTREQAAAPSSTVMCPQWY